MAEQTFKSPGFFEREIEVISRPIAKTKATPAGLIGPAQRGPAFVPTTVSSIEEYIRIFGKPDRRMLGGHAATEFFRNNGEALTFCRTLGSGHYDSGITNAGFKLVPTRNGTQVTGESVFFVAAQHKLADAEFLGLGHFTDNTSHTTDMDLLNGVLDTDDDPSTGALGGIDAGGGTADQKVELIRAMILTKKSVAVDIVPANPVFNGAEDDVETVSSENKIILQIDNIAYAVSLNPSDSDYISKKLNTDPLKFEEKGHLLYAHFPVDNEVASPSGLKCAVVYGRVDGAIDYAQSYGDFSSKFTSPRTTSFISQPFGVKEYDLFHFESLDDGSYASSKYKISISNLRASTDPTSEYGTFTVSVRDIKDTDESQIIYETFTNCSLDPNSASFIGKVIGDQKLYYNYETEESERRLVREGSFTNNSTKIRVVVSDDVLSGEAPESCLPFGFRGVPALLLNGTGRDGSNVGTLFTTLRDIEPATNLNKSILPPLPYRFKVTKGSIKTGLAYKQTFTGEASSSESVDLTLYWGLMSTRIKDIDNANSSIEFNEILLNYTKFLGISNNVISTSLADSHNNNKFSLSKVALKAGSTLTVEDISGSPLDVFKDAVYVRNADVSTSLYDSANHLIVMKNSEDDLSAEDADQDSQVKRISLAKLLADDKRAFNKYSVCAKFTAPFYGGFDGLNVLDSDSYYMTDRAASTEGLVGGKASASGFDSGLSTTTNAVMQGANEKNNVIASYRNAIQVMTEGMVVNHNILVIPNIRDPFITDDVKIKIEEYGKALYLMDIPQFDAADTRVFVDEKGVASSIPDVDATASVFNAREVDSNYVATYFPDVKILDFSDEDTAAITSRRIIKVTPSIIALGALAKTDDISQPWFAPAGFSRGSLETIQSIDVRLNASDRDTLYEARINPIANFPNKQFVIFGQKTTQLARTALDRVNVRRLVLDVKRRIGKIAQGLLFEQNNQATRDRFIEASSLQLAAIQIGQGIEDFRVIMDNTNNTDEDVDNNRLNGKIIIVPTRAIEFIAIDFVITNAGVEFP